MIELVDFDIADFLRDPAAAAEYLSAVIEDGDQHELLQALADLARARGVTDFPTVANTSQDDVRNAPEEDSSLTIATMQSILNACGLQLLVIPKGASDAKPDEAGTD